MFRENDRKTVGQTGGVVMETWLIFEKFDYESAALHSDISPLVDLLQHITDSLMGKKISQ